MTHSDKSSPSGTFYVGLCLAGAVSAGAYTAGVMDYLIEALQEWEKRRGEPGVPTHRVEIPVIGGASAGGMTAMITAAALYSEIDHINSPATAMFAERPENKLYHSWVDLSGEDMLSQMLDVADISKGKVYSLLNSSFIDSIAERAIKVEQRQRHYPFFSEKLKVFTTLSSLNGLQYNVAFNTSEESSGNYYMKIHNDYACFELSDISKEMLLQQEKGEQYNNGWMPLNFYESINTTTAIDAAMATGAFPLGLRARLLQRNSGYVNALGWLKQATQSNKLPVGSYQTFNVDGGLINNEPFEKIAGLLRDVTGESEEQRQSYKTFASTVLMIDPFPSVEPEVFKPKPDVLNVAGSTLSAMIGQMRAKPTALGDALAEECAGQFLIAPVRKIKKNNGEIVRVAGEKAIACGSLDGFGGFISKEFRIHDYFLGRFNCKRFLRDYFTIAENDVMVNPVFKEGYSNADRKRFASETDGKLQIIPVFKETTDFDFPEIRFKHGETWPMVTESELNKYNGKIQKRVQSVLLNMSEMGKFNQFLLWGGAKLLLNRTLTKSVLTAVRDGLRKWELLK